MTTPRNVSSWLPPLIGPVGLQADGEEVETRRGALNFIGATLTDDPDNDRIDIAFDASTGEANTASNVTAGGGVGLWKAKSGVDLQFKSLKAGTYVTVTSGTSDVTLDVANLAASLITSGTLAQARGGLATDVSAISGLLKNTAGTISGVTAPAGAIVGTTDSQTFTNKTIDGANNTITNVAISTAVSGLGTGVATFLGTPSSANLRSALTDETGTGAAVFATSPTIDAPVISGNPSYSGSQSSTTNNAKGQATEINPLDVQTTDATPATLDTIDLGVTSLTGAILATWLVTATKSDGSEAAAYSVTALFRAAGSTSLTQVGSTTTTVIAESDAAWDATADVSGGDARLRVTGKAATTIRWTAVCTKLQVIP